MKELSAAWSNFFMSCIWALWFLGFLFSYYYLVVFGLNLLLAFPIAWGLPMPFLYYPYKWLESWRYPELDKWFNRS